MAALDAELTLERCRRKADELRFITSAYQATASAAASALPEIMDSLDDSGGDAASGDAALAAATEEESVWVKVPLEVGATAATLLITLPRSYPAAPLSVSITDDRGLSRAAREALATALQAEAQAAAEREEEAVWAVVQAAELVFEAEAEAEAGAAAANEREGSASASEAAAETPPATSIKRVAIYSHHIIAETKREAIREEAVQLRLGGLVKHGWPGIIVVEGLASDVVGAVVRVGGCGGQQSHTRTIVLRPCTRPTPTRTNCFTHPPDPHAHARGRPSMRGESAVSNGSISKRGERKRTWSRRVRA